MKKSQAWWYTLITPALEKPRQENGEFEASLGYTRHFTEP
jgi:hypothetical protein